MIMMYVKMCDLFSSRYLQNFFNGILLQVENWTLDPLQSVQITKTKLFIIIYLLHIMHYISILEIKMSKFIKIRTMILTNNT